jgi:hypothetical protein
MKSTTSKPPLTQTFVRVYRFDCVGLYEARQYGKNSSFDRQRHKKTPGFRPGAA